MKYLSLFSGIGGFELGIQQAYEELYNLRPNELADSERPKELHESTDKLQQWECVGYSEIDKYAIQIYEKHFNHTNFGDITKINVSELPDFDLLCGGFPCQSFSIAGKRGGFEDTRGTLFFEIAKIVRVKRPKIIFLENVKGLLSHDAGNTFATIIGTIDELGYDCQWQVLNSKNFGVPQNRERVFIIGHLRGTPRPKVFPIGQDSQADYVVPTLTTRYATGQSNGAYLRKISPKGLSQSYRVYDPNGLSTTLASQAGGMGAKTGLYAIPVLSPDRLVKRQNGRRIKENGEPAFTITAQDRLRRLTPLECERLQGFPDGWTEQGKISDNQRYKCLGNAVTVNVIKAIIYEIN